MYQKNKNHMVTVRLNERQYYYLKGTCDTYGIKPSEFLRLVIDQAQSREKNGSELIEDLQTNSNHKF